MALLSPIVESPTVVFPLKDSPVTHPGWAIEDTVLSNTVLMNAVIEKTDIRRCVIYSCILKNCQLYDCVVENSTLYTDNEEIFRRKKYERSGFNPGLTIVNSCLVACLLTDCSVFKCSVANTELTLGKLGGCSLLTSVVNNANITECLLNRTSPTDCKTYAPLALQRFPAEIRSMIIGFMVGITYKLTGRTMHLKILNALRGDQELYQEALRIIFRDTSWKLTPNDWNGYDKFSMNVLQRFKFVSVLCDEEIRMEPVVLPAKFDFCWNIRRLDLKIKRAYEIAEWADVAVKKFPKLLELRLITCEKSKDLSLSLQVMMLNKRLHHTTLKYDVCVSIGGLSTFIWNEAGYGYMDF